MAQRNTRHSIVDYAGHRQEAARLRDLYIHHIVTRGLRRLSPPRPVAWSGAAALLAAFIGWMVFEKSPMHRPSPERPAAQGLAPAGLPVPAGLANASYEAN